MDRKIELNRKTAETDINMSLNLDGSGRSHIDTGIGFFDHMLTLFSRHSFCDLDIKASGDLKVDAHHTVEDTGIVLGQAIRQTLGNKSGISRYGSAHVPMDEALAMAVIDLGGRPYLVFNMTLPSGGKTGEMDNELVEEFFRAVVNNAGMNLHIKVYYGNNAHHMIEAAFKAFARALNAAVRTDARIEGILSTKGILT